MKMVLLSLEKTTLSPADRALLSFSQIISVTLPDVAWQLMLAELLPAMRASVGLVITASDMGSVRRHHEKEERNLLLPSRVL